MFEQQQTAEQESGVAKLSQNIKSAYLGALAVWILIYSLIPENSYNSDFYFPDGAKITIANGFFLGYILAAFVLWFFRRSYLLESLPLWLGISVLGSTLSMLVGALAIDALIVMHPMVTVTDLGRFVIMIFGTIILSIYTSPLTFLVLYFPQLKQRLKNYFQVI